METVTKTMEEQSQQPVQQYVDNPSTGTNEVVAAQPATAQAQAQGYRTEVVKISDTFLGMLIKHFESNGMPLCNYQKQCVSSSLTAIYTLLDKEGILINDNLLDRSSITTALLRVAALKLNPAAIPSEVFFRIRSVYCKDNNNEPYYIKKVEADVEGDGNETLVARYGRDVKTVHNYWLVRVNDVFEYPKYRGIDVEPPVWKPTGDSSPVIRVVYPITKTNGMTEYHIAERADVINNLTAHIKNNMQKETFGIAKNSYYASDTEKQQINDRKHSIIMKIQELGLDQALSCLEPNYAQYISPAWKELVSREAMIIRKMRNNILKKIPKDFSANPYAQAHYQEMNTFRRDIEPSRNLGQGGNYYNRTHEPHPTHPDMYESAKDTRAFVDEKGAE